MALSPSDPVADDVLVGQILDSKYELIRRLGQGGMGAVYRARRKHIGDEVAIKVLLDKFVAGSEATERFRREARAAAMLRHPNVVAIHDFSEGSGASSPAYIVMELVEGRSLRDLLDQEGRIGAERLITLMRGVCSGVGAAHRKGVVHRDLKPDNIIIIPPERAGDQETVKVIDFGIAKLREADAGAGLTQTGVLIGTPFYMSPEQCLGDPLDARSDIYSIGAILYEMLAGVPPFRGNTPTAVLARHLTDTATPLDQLGVPACLASVPGRALAKDPQERYQTVDDLFRDLSNAVTSLGSSTIGVAETVRIGANAPTIASLSVQQTGGMGGTTIAGAGKTQPMAETQALVDDRLEAQSEARAELSRRLRWARNLGLIGGVLVFGFSIGFGFLLRWLGWAYIGSAYDEVALELITIALRDAIFGVFVGIILSAIRLRRRSKTDRSHWVSSLLTYGSTGAAIAMLPFVLLRTSMSLLPVGIAILGLVAGLIICGVKILIHQFAKKH
jgi:serine/threonine-protein kinase